MIKRRLFKFKQSNKESVDDLINNRLWISNLYLMNDPMDLALFIDSKKVETDFNNNKIIKFQAHITKQIFCASFTPVYTNKRLWNYYSGGFSGFALGYRPTDIRKSIKDFGLKIIEDKITYSSTSYDFTDLFKIFLKDESKQMPFPWKSLFTKDKSWSEEKEYRFSLLDVPPNLKITEKGFKLLNLKPCVIYVGYKMDKEMLSSITLYSKKNNIPLNMYMPKFDSKKIDFQAIEIIN